MLRSFAVVCSCCCPSPTSSLVSLLMGAIKTGAGQEVGEAGHE